MRPLTRARRLRHRLEPGGRCLILLYHRIDRPIADPWWLAVSPENFEEHMRVLREDYVPMPLDAMVAALRRGRVPDRGVAVTFDDGYADNLLAGLPVLERHGVPATVYVTTGLMGTADEFWWKRIEYLLLEPGDLPEVFRVRCAGRTWEWRVGAQAAVYGEDDALPHSRWLNPPPDAPRAAFPTARHAVFWSMLRRLERLDDVERTHVIDALFAQACGRPPRASHRILGAEEANRLADSPLVDLGAHTVTHPHLSRLAPSRQAAEITGSKRRLEEVIGRPVTTFAYPFGQPADVDRTTVRLVREAGFRSAGIVRDIAVSRSSSPWELPRVGMTDCGGGEFARRLEWWLRRGLRDRGRHTA